MPTAWDPADDLLTVAAHQAAGMLAYKSHCDICDAYDMLRAASAVSGRSVNETALDVIQGVIRFAE